MNRREFIRATGCATVASAFGIGFAGQSDAYDLAIIGGRVMDPDTNTDAKLNIAIKNGRIVKRTTAKLNAKQTLLADGCVVCPGFIDIIAHGMDIENNRYQAMDGVTTVLDMESGSAEIDKWYADRKGMMLLNYGASSGHSAARGLIFPDEKQFENSAATEAQINEMARTVETNLKKGALGVGMGIEYYPGASHWEIYQMFRVAARYNAPVHVHVRYGTVLEPGSALEGIQEVIACAAATGAPLHIVHVPSMGLSNTPELLKVIGEAQRNGMDITADAYPYTAFGTGIGSAVFAEGWQQRFAMDYGDLQWAETGERLTRETFEKYREKGGMVIAHAIPESAVRAAIGSPNLMVGSDGGLRNGVGHPRSAGTFARVMGKYVREERLLSLMQAIKKVTLMPANRLSRHCAAMRRKGRLAIGCDADVTVFDPQTIRDNATYDKPAQYSSGVRHLVVGGSVVVRDGVLKDDLMPGRAVRV